MPRVHGIYFARTNFLVRAKYIPCTYYLVCNGYLMEKNPLDEAHQGEALPLLPDTIPVSMPDLPLRLTISTEQQFKAISDIARSRILGVIQYQPLTARQIAQRLQATPGAIGHHLHVLEEAGLVKVVARRITHGIVASYYTRAARIFDFSLPSEIRESRGKLNTVEKARTELLESIVSYEDDPLYCEGFPHVRLTLERMREYQRRFFALIDELIEEPPDPNGEVYGVFFSMFKAPPYMQISEKTEGQKPIVNEKENS